MDAVYYAMEKHGWSFSKARRLIRRVSRSLTRGDLTRDSFESAAALLILVETGHPSVEIAWTGDSRKLDDGETQTLRTPA